MRESSAVGRREAPTESLFSDKEAPSFCLRPTPLLPPSSSQVRAFESEPNTELSSATHALQTRSSPRSTVGLGELLPPSYTAAQAVDVVNDLLAKRRVRARASLPNIQIPLPLPTAITIEVPTRRLQNVRRIVARGVFLLLLGVLLGFIGYVFRSGFVSALHELRARIAVLTATR